MNSGNIIQLKSEDYKKCQNIWDMFKQPFPPKWYDELISGNRTLFVYQLKGEYIGKRLLFLIRVIPNIPYPINGFTFHI